MSTFIERLRAELIARVTGLPGTTDDPLESRGQQPHENTLPRVWVWIDSDEVTQRAKPDDGEDPSRVTEYHSVSFSVGVMAKNSTAAAVVDALVGEIRERMFPRFEGADFLFQRVEYEDEVRTYARPFVSAAVEYTITYVTP